MPAHRLFPHALLTTALTVAACAAAPAAAGAANPGWLSPTTVSQGEGGPYQQVAPSSATAVAPDGTVVTVFKHGSSAPMVLNARVRDHATGEWAPAVQISDAESVGEVRIVAGSDGNITVMWSANSGLKAKTFMDSSYWGTTETLETQAYGDELVASPDGGVTAAYGADIAGGNHVVRLLTRPAGSSTFSSEGTDLNPSAGSQWAPNLAYNASGDGVLTWGTDIGSNHDRVLAARYDHATDTWSAAAPLPAETDDVRGDCLAIDNSGNAAYVWGTGEVPNGGGASHVFGASMSPDGTWSSATVLMADFRGALPTDKTCAVADEHGHFLTIWQEYDTYLDGDSVLTANFGTSQAIAHTLDTANGQWGHRQIVGGDGALGGAPAIAADSDGNAIVVALGSTDMAHLQYVPYYRPATGTDFTHADGASLVSAADGAAWCGVPDLTTDAQGNYYASYGQGPMDYSTCEVGFTVGDAAGPSLGSLSFQTSGGVDEDFSFSVSPLDAWSALGATTWSFGDDTSASGTSVSHRFASAGTYTVTATSTDALGNSSSESQTVTVTAPPTPPAPPEIRKEQIKLPPVIPARLAGKKITITTTVPNCSAKFIATTKFGTTKYQTKLKLTQTGKTCTATGTIVLKKTPSTRTKLRVTIGRVTKRGTSTIKTLTTKRG